MDKFFLKKERACRIILFSIFVFAILNFINFQKPLAEILEEEIGGFPVNFQEIDISAVNIDRVNSVTKKIEEAINDNIAGKNWFIELYGYLNILMGKNEQSNFETVRDKNGSLYDLNFTDSPPEDIFSFANEINEFKKNIATDAQFLYILTPDKYIKNEAQFSIGMPNDFRNETADIFLRYLVDFGIDTIDLRETIAEGAIPYHEMFYKTGLYWKIETGFYVFTKLVDILNEKYGLQIDEDGFFRNIDNYNKITYPNSYVGYFGKKTGVYYSGADDFSIIYPKYKTNFEVSAGRGSTYENTISGLFENVLISVNTLISSNSAYGGADKYYSYIPNSSGITHIKNINNPNAPKIVFIKDSMINPVISFLSIVCSDIYVIDSQYYTGDTLEFVNSLDANFIVFSFCPRNISEEYIYILGKE